MCFWKSKPLRILKKNCSLFAISALQKSNFNFIVLKEIFLFYPKHVTKKFFWLFLKHPCNIEYFEFVYFWYISYSVSPLGFQHKISVLTASSMLSYMCTRYSARFFRLLTYTLRSAKKFFFMELFWNFLESLESCFLF